MIAPIDSKASFMVEGETITLRLNFRSIALAEEHGIDLLGEDAGIKLSATRSAILVKCLAVQEHPDFTEDHTLAVVAKAPNELAVALIELFTQYGGIAEEPTVGNARGRRPKKLAA